MEKRAQEFCSTISGILNDGGDRMFDDYCVEEKNDVLERQVTYEHSSQKKTNFTLKKHVTSAICIKKYKCEHCHKMFARSGNLKTHL